MLNKYNIVNVNNLTIIWNVNKTRRAWKDNFKNINNLTIIWNVNHRLLVGIIFFRTLII